MKRRSKTLLVIGMVSAVLVAGLVVAYLIISMDEDPTDDSDLRLARLDIPDDQNGYTYFAQAAQTWVWPGIEKKDGGSRADVPRHRRYLEGLKIDEDRLERLESVLDGSKRDDALAAELLKSNEAALALCDRGLACSSFQWPEALNFEDGLYDVHGLLQLASLMRLRSQVLLRAGKNDDAWQEAIKVVHFGHIAENGRGVLVGWIIGRTVKDMGLETLREMLRDSSLPPDRLKQYAADLKAFSDDGAGLAQTLCAEYQCLVNILEDFRGGRYSLEDLCSIAPKANHAVWQRHFSFRYNETRRLLAEPMRVVVENASKPYSEAKPYDRTRYLRSESWDTMNLRNLLAGNIYGRMFVTLFTPSFEPAVRMKCRGQTHLAATRTLIAMKAFKTRTGRLPDVLTELVPEFLDAVPLDDFDGKPIRYSREKKCVYSVGADLVDSGGHSKEGARQWWTEHKPDEPLEDAADPDTWSLPDPSFFIEF